MDNKNYYGGDSYPPNQGYPSNQGYNNQGYPPQQQYQGYPPQQQYQGYPPQQQYQNYAPQTSAQYGQNYPPQQDYANQYQPEPPNYGNVSLPPEVNPNEKFKNATKFNDIWAAVLFVIQLAGFIVLSVFMIRSLNFSTFKAAPSRRPDDASFGEVFTNYRTFLGLGSSALVAGVLGLIYVLIMQFAARILIIISFWFSALLYLAAGAYFIYRRIYIAGVIFLVFGVIYAFLWFSWRSRIPFSTIMLKNVSKFTRNYPGTIFISLIFLIISIGYTIYWAFTITGATQYYALGNGKICEKGPSGRVNVNDPSCKTNPGLYGIYVFSLFSLFWTTQLLKDVTHMTISGTFAADYFFPSTTTTASRFTTFSALGRSLTTSFGSACFGSLLVAIVQLLKTLAQEARQGSDNLALAFLACCAECILAQIEALLEYFNKYAYCYCSIYGLPYITAGKATWNLIKDRGVEAIINDSLIGNVLGLGTILISIIAAGVGYGVASSSNILTDGGAIAVVVVVSFIIGVLVCSVIFQVIESANSSFFVCLAEDPQALASYNPELFESIRQTYPQVIVPV